MSSRTILQLAGQPGAGKTEVSNYLVEEHGFVSVGVSGLVRAYAIPRGIDLKDRLDYKAAHTQLLAELGQYAICDAITETPSDRICVDGMRVPAHAERLRSYSPSSKIVALHCPPHTRFERTTQRGRGLDNLLYEDFLRDELLESRSPDPFDVATLTVMEMADYDIDSSQPLPQVQQSIYSIVTQLLR